MEIKKLTLNTQMTFGQDIPVFFRIDHYVSNDNLFVGLVTDRDGFYEPWNDLTTNIGRFCEPNCSFIDINNNGIDVLDWLLANHLGELTGRVECSGFCDYPEFRFNMDELNKYLLKEDEE